MLALRISASMAPRGRMLLPARRLLSTAKPPKADAAATPKASAGAGAAPKAPKGDAPKSGGGGNAVLKVAAAAAVTVVVTAVGTERLWIFHPMCWVARLATKGEWNVSAGSVSGSLSKGTVEFRDLHVVHKAPAHDPLVSVFDIKVARQAFKFDFKQVWEALKTKGGRPVCESLEMSGIRGEFVRARDSPPYDPDFVVKNTTITDADVQCRGVGQPPELNTRVVWHKYTVPLVRSEKIPVDMLLGASAEGTVDGHPVSISGALADPTKSEASDRVVLVERVPVRALQAMAPQGSPFEWVTAGHCRVEMKAHYNPNDKDWKTELGLNVTFAELAASGDNEKDDTRKALANLTGMFLKAQPGFPLNLNLTVTEDVVKKWAKKDEGFAKFLVGSVGDALVQKVKGKSFSQVADWGTSWLGKVVGK